MLLRFLMSKDNIFFLNIDYCILNLQKGQVNTHADYMLFYHMNCLIETGVAVKHFPGFITALYLFCHQSFSCFSEKVGDFKTRFFYKHRMSVFKRNVVKSEKEEKIVLWL